MPTQNSFGARGELRSGGRTYGIDAFFERELEAAAQPVPLTA